MRVAGRGMESKPRLMKKPRRTAGGAKSKYTSRGECILTFAFSWKGLGEGRERVQANTSRLSRERSIFLAGESLLA